MRHRTLRSKWRNLITGLSIVLIPMAIGLAAIWLVLQPQQIAVAQLAPNGTPDRYEPNDSVGAAKAITEAFPVANLTFARSGDGNFADDDWYSLPIDNNFVVTLTASANGTFLQVTVFNADATSTVGQNVGPASATVSSYVFTNTTGNSIFFKALVKNNGTQDGSNYTLNLAKAPTVGIVPTIGPTPGIPDIYEPNDTPALVNTRKVSFINVGSLIQNVNFFTPTGPVINGTPFELGTQENGDVDWFFFYARKHVSLGGTGGVYRIATSITAGVDTEIFIFSAPPPGDDIYSVNKPSNTVNLIGSNDDLAPTQRQSQFDLTASADGVYWIKVWNKDPTPRGPNQTYSISVLENPLPATNTPVATTSPVPATAFPGGFDQFEYNGDFSFSTLIAPNTKYSNLNFVPYQPPSPDTPDNDFFRMPVRQGLYYTCETLDLSQGTDTNLIIYSQPNYDSGITGNDNISEAEFERGNFASRVSWLSGFTGYAYILVGQVTPSRSNEAAGRTYALQCTIGLPNTPTPIASATPLFTPTPLVPPTPVPPEATLTPFPTPRPAQNLPVRELPPAGAEVLPTQPPAATPMAISLDVQVFIDQNKNGLLDRNEGIANVSVRILDETNQTPLGQAFTDGEGRVRFAITNEGPVRLSVPLFGYSTVVSEPNAIVRIGITPQLQLPEKIP